MELGDKILTFIPKQPFYFDHKLKFVGFIEINRIQQERQTTYKAILRSVGVNIVAAGKKQL
jgi:hypothetical protein